MEELSRPINTCLGKGVINGLRQDSASGLRVEGEASIKRRGEG